MLPKIVLPLFLKSASLNTPPITALQIKLLRYSAAAPTCSSGPRNDQHIKLSINQQILDKQQNMLIQQPVMGAESLRGDCLPSCRDTSSKSDITPLHSCNRSPSKYATARK